MLEVTDLRTEIQTSRGVVHAVNGVSLRVGAGETLGIVGESGCGKSVTIRSVLGLIRPPLSVVGGSAMFQGRDLLQMSQKELRHIRGREIGFVAQNPFGIFNPVLRIRSQFHNLMRAHRSKVTRRDSYEAALGALKSVGITAPERVLNGYAHELSGGMAQRVGIAMAFLLNPRLIVADEPTTALDVTIQRQILELILELVGAGDRSMVLVTHDLGVVAQYCQQVAVLYAGKVVESGPVSEVFLRPSHPYTAALLNAVPRPGRQLINLQGRLPSLIDYPPGCPFAPRCAFVLEQCLVNPPQLESVAGLGVSRSCHRPRQEVIEHAAAEA